MKPLKFRNLSEIFEEEAVIPDDIDEFFNELKKDVLKSLKKHEFDMKNKNLAERKLLLFKLKNQIDISDKIVHKTD